MLKNQKDLYVSFMKDAVHKESENEGELNSLHHEFNISAARASSQRVKLAVAYCLHKIYPISIPFTLSLTSCNFFDVVTKVEVDDPEYYFNCLSFGKQLFCDYVKDRLLLKEVHINGKPSAISSMLNLEV